MKDKVFTYIGFSVKAGKVRLGVNAISTLKGKISLLLLCDTASRNTKNDALKLAKKYSSRIVLSKTYKLEEVFYKDNCKLAAILDESLAKAILDNLNENFVEFGG